MAQPTPTCTSCNTFGDREARDCLRAFPADRKYNVIYADPPWRYESDGNLAHKPYPTMSYEELAALPVGACAAPDSACFMWTSNPMLDKAVALMAAWGFTYKTVFKVWTKRTAGGAPARVPGYWSMSSVELLLVGSRGGMQKYKRVNDESQEYASVRGVHSEKPAAVRDSIRRLFEVDRRLEIFARHVCDGWDAWGLDIPGYIHQEGVAFVPRRREVVRVVLKVDPTGAASVRANLLVIECGSRGAQTRVMTMRRPTFDTPKPGGGGNRAPAAQTKAPPPAVLAPPPPPVPPPPAAASEDDMRKDRDRVPVVKGGIVVRGPARPSRANFERWWNSVNRDNGQPNSRLYRVPPDFLAGNPDIARVVAAAA